MSRCLDPQTPPEKAFSRSKHLLTRYLEDFGRLGYSQENSWKNQPTKSSSIKRGHYLTYLANPNNGLFVWGKPFKITIHLCSVWSTSKQVLSKDPCQKASTSWKTTAQTSRFPNAKKVVLGFACSMLKKGSKNILPKGGLMVMNIMVEFLIKSPIKPIQAILINSFRNTAGRNLANHLLGLLHSITLKHSWEIQRMSDAW